VSPYSTGEDRSARLMTSTPAAHAASATTMRRSASGPTSVGMRSAHRASIASLFQCLASANGAPGVSLLEAVGYFLRPVRRLSRSTTVLPGRRFSVPLLRKRPVIVSRTRLPLPAPRFLAMG
jgi:hypothetical protein